MAEQIQALWSHVHQDVLTRLNNGCESFRVELDTQICLVIDIQGQVVHGADRNNLRML